VLNVYGRVAEYCGWEPYVVAVDYIRDVGVSYLFNVLKGEIRKAQFSIEKPL